MRRLDPPALHAALDAGRTRLGFAWSDVARDTGVAAATIARLRTGGRFETDGILQLTGWLARPIEDFTTDDGA